MSEKHLYTIGGEAALLDAQAEIASLRQELESTKDELRGMRAQAELAQMLGDALESQLREVISERDSLRNENARLRAAHGHQQQEISVMRDREIAAGCVDDYMSQAEQLDKLRQENERLREACVKTNDEICQTLGKALGYPWYKDDPENFPDATEENGVCTGDHVAESIAMEAARIIGELRSENERLSRLVVHDSEGRVVTQGAFNQLICQNELLRKDAERLNSLLERSLAIITDAIMHGMPITEEVASVRNEIVNSDAAIDAAKEAE